MKNLQRLTIVIILAAITSCSKSKDRNACYECKQITEQKEGQVVVSFSSSTTTYCNKSEEDIRKFQQDNNYSKTTNGITTTNTCKCEVK